MNRKDRRANKATGTSQGTMSPLLAQALQFHKAGQVPQAEAAYRRLLAQNGRDADATYLLGVLCAQKGALAEAERLLKLATQLRPVFPDAWFNLGVLNLQGRFLAEAEAALRTCLKQQPQHGGAIWNLGNLCLEIEKLEEAETLFRQFLRLQPGNIDALHSLAMAVLGLRRFKEAEALARQVLAAKPSAEVRALLGQILFINSAYQEAEPLLRDALRERPQLVEARTSLAALLRRTGDLTSALDMLSQLAAERPQDSVVLLNLSMCLKDLGRYDEAVAQADKALRLNPSDADLRRSRSQLLLQAGRLEEGWQDHGARFDSMVEPVKRMNFPFPPLIGDDDTTQQTILVWPEQGVGDHVTYVSALHDLIERAQAVELLTVPKLAPLFRRSFPKARVITEAAESKATRHMPVGDLFSMFRLRIADFPQKPYLTPDPVTVAKLRARLDALGPGLKIGIGWRSTSTAPERVKYFFPSLLPWAPVLSLPGVTFINFQPQAKAEELEEARSTFGCRIQSFDDIDLFNDLDSAAALAGALDLIICNGSANAFLAAAAGAPVWMFYLADSHWVSLGTDRIPWLASLTAVERLWHEDWSGAMQRMRQALDASLCEGRLIAPATPSPLRKASVAP